MYMDREITRADLREVIRRGLEQGHGNYKVVAGLFNMEEGDYITGCPSCAWEVYDRIEQLQRGNPDAAAGKTSVQEKTLEQIRAQIDQGGTEDALALIEAAEFYFKDNAETLEELAGLRQQAGQ